MKLINIDCNKEIIKAGNCYYVISPNQTFLSRCDNWFSYLNQSQQKTSTSGV